MADPVAANQPLIASQVNNYDAISNQDRDVENQEVKKTCCSNLRGLCSNVGFPSKATVAKTALSAVVLAFAGFGLYSTIVEIKNYTGNRNSAEHDKNEAVNTIIGYLQFLSPHIQDLAYCVKNQITPQCVATDFEPFNGVDSKRLDMLSTNFTQFLKLFYDTIK